MSNIAAPNQAGAACCKGQHPDHPPKTRRCSHVPTCKQPTTSHSLAVDRKVVSATSHPVRHLSPDQHPTQLLLTPHLQTCAAPPVQNPLLLTSGESTHNQECASGPSPLTETQQPSSPCGTLWLWHKPGHRAADALELEPECPLCEPQVTALTCASSWCWPQPNRSAHEPKCFAHNKGSASQGCVTPLRAHSQAPTCMSTPVQKVAHQPFGTPGLRMLLPPQLGAKGGSPHSHEHPHNTPTTVDPGKCLWLGCHTSEACT